ncbi:MAG: enoyl-CoA hydratase-related protein [Dokdonella sp.]
MDFRNLLSNDSGAVRTLTINRPDKLNALNGETIAELHQAIEQARVDDGVRVVVLAGAGEKAFVAGADIAELEKMTPIDARAFSRAGQSMMRALEMIGKPVIARLQGFTLGGGLELAMSCHFRVASNNAQFGLPEITLGLLPGFGGTQRLLRLAGRSATLEMCLFGKRIDAARALQLGIVNRVVDAGALDAEIDALTEQLAASAPRAMAAILDAVLIGGECTLDLGLDYESNAFALCFSTTDMREGTSAFLARRTARFIGT